MFRFYSKPWLASSITTLTVMLLTPCLGLSQLKYPNTKTVDKNDEYFGVSVADPFVWLEDDVRESEDVAEWVEAQNKVTFEYLKNLPNRKQIEERLTELWDYEKFGTPFKRGGRYYYYRNDGLQNQSVLYRMDTLDSEPQILIDPNTWSKDGTVALGGLAFSCLLYTSPSPRD